MSSLMVSNDLEIMMLEFAVQKLFVPKISIFDSVIMKKTTVMFRMLDYDWTGLSPHRTDYVPYRGSNLEEEDFHGGKSVVFAMPSASLEKKVNGIDIQIHVRKEVSKYFEMDSCQNVGIALINVDALFNGIIKELGERKELEEYLSGFHKRQPISRSLKGTYEIMNEDQRITGATIMVYVRLSHFGKSIITEIETGRGKRKDFYVQEEMNEVYPYQCRELKISKLEAGCWGSETFLPPVRPDELTCHCDTWDPMHEQDDKSEDSDDETSRGKLDSYEHQIVENDKIRASRDDRMSYGNGKKGLKGKKVSKGDGVRDSIEKNDVSAGQRGNKSKANEKLMKKISPIDDGSKVKKKTVTGSAKKGGKSSRQDVNAKVLEKLEKSPYRNSIGSARSSDPTKMMEKPVERDSSKKTDGKVDSKDQKMSEKLDYKSAHRTLERKSAHRTSEQKSTHRTSQQKNAHATLERKSEAASNVDGTKTTNVYGNRRMQLRRRQCGIVTVGLQNKEKKICPGALETSSTSPTTLSPVLQVSTSIQPTICSDLYSLSHCCYPSISNCKPTMCLPLSCSMDTRNDRSYRLFGRPDVINIPEMVILTN